MSDTHYVKSDLAYLYRRLPPPAGSTQPPTLSMVRVMVWGDRVRAAATTETEDGKRYRHVAARIFLEQPDGSIVPEDIKDALIREDALGDIAERKVLAVSVVDVQQGDGILIESPTGETILIDGGDNQLFARYLANRFTGTTVTEPKEVDCILITHGDADHFSGLSQIEKSETHQTPHKRLFLKPQRVYHNGLVKAPSKLPTGKNRPEKEMLGETEETPGTKAIITELYTDLTNVPDTKMNEPFRKWKATLKHWENAHSYKVEFARLSAGDDKAFDFFVKPLLASGIAAKAEVLGPILSTVNGKSGLKFLGEPPKGDPTLPDEDKEFKGFSASHTINGHSVILRLTFGAFRFLFAGDLNREAEAILTRDHKTGKIDLESEVLKVPHHGSHDYSFDFLSAIHPLVSVVSSGDESARKEYIHPRANLMASLGKAARSRQPLIFVTELVAFFSMMDYCFSAEDVKKFREGKLAAEGMKRFFGFKRAAFGLVKFRTDGERFIVVTDSANVDMKEAYRYRATGAAIVPEPMDILK